MKRPEKLFRSPAFLENDIACSLMFGRRYFALFSDLGTAKTYMLIRDFVTHYQAGLVDNLFVVTPTAALARQWIEEEWPLTTSLNCAASAWPEPPPSPNKRLPRVFAIYPAAFNRTTKRGTAIWNMCRAFIESGRTGVVIDESQMLGNISSKQTRRIKAFKPIAHYRRIASGFPAPVGKIQLLPQYNFLSTNILRCETKGAFVKRYCVMGGFKKKEIIGYKNEDDFTRRVAPYTYTVDIDKCHTKPGIQVKMPERTWMDIKVELTVEQRRLIEQIKKEFKAELSGGRIVRLPSVLQRITRVQQIACGFLPIVDDKGIQHGIKQVTENRTKALEELLGKVRGKVLVWCHFTYCIERLAAHFYDCALMYRGGMTAADERWTKHAFIHDPKRRVLFVQPSKAAAGMNGLTVSRYSFYWSNPHNAQMRRQGERRTWRLGQSRACVYGDFIAEGTYDAKIRDAVVAQQNVADSLLDDIGAWRRV